MPLISNFAIATFRMSSRALPKWDLSLECAALSALCYDLSVVTISGNNKAATSGVPGAAAALGCSWRRTPKSGHITYFWPELSDKTDRSTKHPEDFYR